MHAYIIYPQLSQLLLFTATAVFVNLEGIMVARIASGSTLGRAAFGLSGQTLALGGISLPGSGVLWRLSESLTWLGVG